ncbi:MAG: very short patch repair endonuclease [Planctomycetaceae bacterium]|nr:very short patch repair endonuclease [Planctomycetaceae bacterium]
MSQIRSRGNKATELALIRIFREHDIAGWRRHISLSLKISVPGISTTQTPKRHNGRSCRVHPDFVFAKLKLAIFVDGCFWHGCPLHGTQPKSNAAFWRKKLTANKSRDQRVTRLLRLKGWRVLRLWEHDLTRHRQASVLKRIEKACAASSTIMLNRDASSSRRSS